MPAKLPFFPITNPSTIAAMCSAAGEALTDACRTIFETTSLMTGGPWVKIGMLLPELRPIITRLAYAFPDRQFRRQLHVRGVVGAAWVGVFRLRANGADVM